MTVSQWSPAKRLFWVCLFVLLLLFWYGVARLFGWL